GDQEGGTAAGTAGRGDPGGVRHGAQPARSGVGTRREAGGAIPAIGWLPGTPEPSRRPSAGGRSIGAPLLAAARAGPGPARAGTRSIGWLRAPLGPARRPSARGRSIGAPLLAAARAGPGPAQAVTRPSSPLRNRWQRTPPVARPLAGYSTKGVTFTLPASVPGSAEEAPETVTTTASSSGVKAPKNTTR